MHISDAEHGVMNPFLTNGYQGVIHAGLSNSNLSQEHIP